MAVAVYPATATKAIHVHTYSFIKTVNNRNWLASACVLTRIFFGVVVATNEIASPVIVAVFFFCCCWANKKAENRIRLLLAANQIFCAALSMNFKFNGKLNLRTFASRLTR